MAEIEILLQGLNKDEDHETVINNLLSTTEFDSFIFSLAFVRSNGIESIKNNLERVSDRINVFIGIRNGITSVQSIFSFLRIGITPYVVDTASNSIIFHPKIYAGYCKSDAQIILGSANLTFGGLNQNIEASSHIKLDRKEKSDEEYLNKLLKTLNELPSKYPDHVFQVKTARQAVELLKEGRLEDERLTRLPSTNKSDIKKERDQLIPIPTHRKKAQPIVKVINKKVGEKDANKGILVWESNPLTERSLNIPQSPNTNITGDTNLGRGLMKDINFQHYFRNSVFADLDWHTNVDSKSPYLERAIINAELVIKNNSYGIFKLEVTHDPRTNTKSYRQHNAMTKIKWGDTRHLIAKRDLLRRTLRIYKKDIVDFVIVID